MGRNTARRSPLRPGFIQPAGTEKWSSPAAQKVLPRKKQSRMPLVRFWNTSLPPQPLQERANWFRSLAPQNARLHGGLFLRTATVLPVRSETLTVVSSEALDQDLLQEIAVNLGEITLYTIGLRSGNPSSGGQGKSPAESKDAATANNFREDEKGLTVNGEAPHPTLSAGTLPAAVNMIPPPSVSL